MKIPFIDVNNQNHLLKKELLNSLKGVLESGDFILGKQVRLFESEFAKYCDCRYAVGLNSGTDALFLALLSLGVGPGDEVICPVYTYIATALSISYTGAKPVFVDIDARTFNIDSNAVEKKITKKTKAIIPVHLYGQPADMGTILAIARKYKIVVIEDAAQAQGAMWKNNKNQWKKVGSIGDIGCFSFYPTKNLSGCGDGGMAVTNKKKIYERLLMLRDQGRKGKNRYLHYIKGYNSRLASMQAAILRIKLKTLDRENKLRRENAKFYSKLLNDCGGITVPYVSASLRHVYHIYAVLLNKSRKISEQLRRKDIYTSKVYNLSLHLQPAYKELGYKRGDFPVAEKISRDVLCLPMYSQLSQKQIEFLVNVLKKLV
ncbi:MAG: DegT/DnrJ/EryC1/StrS family aminotransferase [PVC group bacterium]|nr:DegT/DnrJ/EryC1/StrS family aminotransferase [PVC group bacterium]